MAHREARERARGESALHGSAEGGESGACRHGGDEREAHAHALQGAHELRGQARERCAAAARERACARRAAHAHRVLRHLDDSRVLYGRVDGRVHGRQARQEPVPPLQDQDAARRGERLPLDAGGDEPPLLRRAYGRRALRQQARPHHPRRRQAAAVGRHGDVRPDGDRRHRAVRPGEARRGALRPLAGHGSGRFALGVGVALPREAGARRGPPVCHHLPPRAARQGHDGKHFRRGRGLGSRSQEGPAQAFQILQEPEGGELGGDQGGPCGARRGRRGAPQGDRAV